MDSNIYHCSRLPVVVAKKIERLLKYFYGKVLMKVKVFISSIWVILDKHKETGEWRVRNWELRGGGGKDLPVKLLCR